MNQSSDFKIILAAFGAICTSAVMIALMPPQQAGSDRARIQNCITAKQADLHADLSNRQEVHDAMERCWMNWKRT
jgi:hypothetical protein